MNTDRLSTAQGFVNMALSRHQSEKGGVRCSHGYEAQPSQLARRCVMQSAVSGCRAVGDVASTRMDVEVRSNHHHRQIMTGCGCLVFLTASLLPACCGLAVRRCN